MDIGPNILFWIILGLFEVDGAFTEIFMQTARKKKEKGPSKK